MLRLKWLVLLVCVAFTISNPAHAADAAPDALKANGLVASGGIYVLNDEVDILKQMPELHKTKKQFDEDTRLRRSYESIIKGSNAFVSQSIKEHNQLNDRLSVTPSAAAHNRIVLRMNQLIIKIKESNATRAETEERLAKLGSDIQVQYVDAVIAQDAKAQAAIKTYQQLAADPAVKAAIVKGKLVAGGAQKLGPSPEFVTAVAELEKLRSAIDAQSIALTEEGGIQLVDALINGEQVKMILDPGASEVTLPGELAEQLKIDPGPKDPIMDMKLADGHVIQVHRMILKSVRVGRFTVENVSCAVMAKGLPGVKPILGNSFLSHFVVKLDQKASQLNLTEVEHEDKKPTATVPPAGDASPAK